jgi:hypothetical protein
MCCIRFIPFQIATTQYFEAVMVASHKYLNGITVKNDGTTLLLFNNEILQPGESKAIGGNAGEIYKIPVINLAFRIPSPVPSTITNLAVVTQKFYVVEE